MSVSTLPLRHSQQEALTQSAGGQEAERKRVMAHARAKGYAGGWSQGTKAAKAAVQQENAALRASWETELHEQRHRMASAVATLAETVQDLQDNPAPAPQDLVDAVLMLALDFAEDIVGRELRVTETPGKDVLQRAMQSAVDVEVVAVRMNPDDLASLTPDDIPEGLTLTGDASIASGDCVVEHPLGSIETVIQEAIARAKMELQQ